MNTIRATNIITAVILCLMIVPSKARAQPTYNLRPYLMIGEMSGDLTTSGVPSDFNLGWGNALTKGNGALGIDFEAKGDDIGLLSQLWYTTLSDTEPNVTTEAYNQAQQDVEGIFLTEVFETSLYSDGPDYFNVNIGGRLSSVTNDLAIRRDSGETNFSQDKFWIDPVVGINGYFSLDEGYALQFGGDYGGFGVASDSTYQVWAALDFIINAKSAFSLGYRALSYDYEKSDFRYQMIMQGPTAGFSFRF